MGGEHGVYGGLRRVTDLTFEIYPIIAHRD